jgi:hypothetical protein
MENQHGGKRANAGRRKGSSHAENRTKHNFRLMARNHSETALQAIVDTMNDLNNPERFIAAKLLVQYAYGRAAGAFTPIDVDKMALLGNKIAAIGGHDEQTID